MSDFITTENKLGKNYQINATKVKLNESHCVKISNHIPELFKVARPMMVEHREEGLWREEGRRGRMSVDAGLGMLCYRVEEERESPGKTHCGDSLEGGLNLPLRNIRTVNLCQVFTDQHREGLGNANSKIISNSTITQAKVNIPSNTTTYCTNETQINKIKTANSSGSSFMFQMQPHSFTSTSQNSIPSDLCNKFKFIKSQNVAFSVKNNDTMLHKNGDEFIKSAVNPKIVNLNNDGSYKPFTNVSFKNNTKLSMTNILGRKDSIPEYYEPEMCEVVNGTYRDNVNLRSPPDTMDDNVSSFHNREETLLPTDYMYTNNCYLPTVNINEARNSMSYINQTIPVVVLNNTVVPNTVSLNAFPQFCLTQLPHYTNDNIAIANSSSSDQNFQLLQNTECSEYVLLRKESIDSTQMCNSKAMTEISLQQQYHLNHELKSVNNYSISDITDSKSVVVDQVVIPVNLITTNESSSINSDLRLIESCHEDDVKTVGKFTVKTSRENNKLTTSSNVTETTEDTCNTNIAFIKDISNEDLNKNTNSDNQQPRSRFKKTRIREIIERWHVNGLNTYDCRFKVIPSKIMNLHDNAIELMSRDLQHHLCQNRSDHDSAFRSYLNEYNNKEFRFWDNGDRIAICGKSDYETENYCQFHAKYLKLLNQNQNMSLSKFVPQSLTATNSTLLSSPQIIRAVLISTPDNDNYTTNIDINVSQNVALSAPPVSPSQMNSVPTSSLPPNLHSPQSSAAMVMLRCHTPVIWSNASKNASLMSESISIEKINYKPSIMSIDSDSGNRTSQSILLTDGTSLIEMLQKSPRSQDSSQFTLPVSNCMVNTGLIDELNPEEAVYNGQQAVYSMGHTPRIFYSIPQQVIPSTCINSKRKQDNLQNLSYLEEYSVPSSLSSTLIQEIDDNLNSLKSMVRNLIQVEQQTLVNEIKSLNQANENLEKELFHVKKRSEYLESILKENNVYVEAYDGQYDTSTVHKDLTGLDQGFEQLAFDR